MPYVLNGLNLHIKAGETVAFIGPSGGGKTTLAKLLLRLYDPVSGELFGIMFIDSAAMSIFLFIYESAY